MKTFLGPRMSAAAYLLVAMTGCGGGTGTPPTHAVSGTVTYLDRPLPDVAIAFYPESGRNAVGKADKDGNFTLMTFAAGDGAVPGTHKVTILLPGAPVSEDLAASDYALPKTSKGPAPFPRSTTSRRRPHSKSKFPMTSREGSSRSSCSTD